MPQRKPLRVAAFVFLTLWSMAAHSADQKAIERAAYLESIRKAEALYKERCATVAGEKIYRKVGRMTPLLKPMRIAAFVLLALLPTACQSVDPKPAAERVAYLESIKKAEALYKERCATVAGEKIYKTVDNVDGVFLMNIPAMGEEREWFQRDWPGAAFAHSRVGKLEWFMQGFLWNEHPRTDAVRTLTTEKTDLPGYRYVDVIDEKDGKRYRYTLVKKARPTSKIGWIDTVIDKAPTTALAPRYGVSFEDRNIPEERALWVASGTIKVIDLQTKEVMGEMTRYAISYTRPGPGASPPWLRVKVCGGHGTSWVERTFVDQVLKPAKGE